MISRNMEKKTALTALSALGQEQRLDIFRYLVQAGPDGAVAGDIASALSSLPNTLSANLSVLSQAGLVAGLREGRNIRYRASMDAMQALLGFLMQDCCGGDARLCEPVFRHLQNPVAAGPGCRTCGDDLMESQVFNVLFLCTGNSARSIIAEACLNREGGGRFRAFSAGSHPKGAVHPLSLALLQREGYDTSVLHSKSWDEFAVAGAPSMDFVFTVCDNAANETCPVWPGQPMTAHWGVPDPAVATGGVAEKSIAFADAYRMLKNRISLFVSLPVASLDRLSLQNRIEQIGKE
jgi:ArsR family transcriptional regulator, arsenate/arsenite/antimonite-responsive transcriptional repressor / arsenate reductase (thioredoxin)